MKTVTQILALIALIPSMAFAHLEVNQTPIGHGLGHTIGLGAVVIALIAALFVLRKMRHH